MIFAEHGNQITVPLWLIGAMAACTLVVWTWAIVRLRSGKRLLPRRRSTLPPWKLADVILAAIVYVFFLTATQSAVIGLVDGSAARQKQIVAADSFATQHPVVIMLQDSDALVWLGCVFAVVIVAPLAEEFLFRLLLQGWLEAALWRWRHLLPTIRRLLPGATGPVLLASLLFGMLHFRVAGDVWPAAHYRATLLATTATNILTVAAIIVILRLAGRATAADLGWNMRRLPGDLRTGAVVFAAVVGPIYGLQILLTALLPKYVAPDPITLFVFSLVLGWLYARTRRLAPPATAHALLNAASLMMLWFSR